MSKYGFYERLSREFPSQVMVDITEVCNLGCIHCTHPKFKLSSVYNKRMINPEINKKTGDIIYIDNRKEVERDIRQKEDVKIILEF